MELKDYQQGVIKDLSTFLETLEHHPRLDDAFREYWAEKGASDMPAYQNNLS